MNPQGQHYRALKDQPSSAYEDTYYGETVTRSKITMMSENVSLSVPIESPSLLLEGPLRS